ncbi:MULTISPECIES: hypothetical protein [Olivibacter]|uniref:Lipoprotein n=1 Tax=Olivibacter jilunii TaxID=985016 RepID=A0ABW6AW71_9SPHI
MKKVFTLLFLFGLLSCSKDNQEPNQPQTEEQKQEEKESNESVNKVKQGLIVEFSKGDDSISATVTVLDEYPNPDDVDFSQENQLAPFLVASNVKASESAYKHYGFELPEGKYLVMVEAKYPQNCPSGSICNFPSYYSLKEIEVTTGDKTTVKLDFSSVDQISNPKDKNYIDWK